MQDRWRVAVITVSDSGARGERQDESGPVLKELVRLAGGKIDTYKVIPDDKKSIEETLILLADHEKVNLVLTTGGTGFAATDVTPEATKAVIHKEAPGLAEAMRLATAEKTPFSMLSRAVAGIRGHTLIVNFPGSPKAVKECFEVIQPVLPHALQLLQGHTKHG